MMGIVRLPKVDDYWRSDLRYAQIAEKILRNRFQFIHWTLHFVDNNTISADEKLDRVWKLRPWIENLKANFLTISSDDLISFINPR